MTQPHPADERLRQAFQALGEHSKVACSEQDLDRIWRAVSGELPARERREMVERVAIDPACAEAWRVAQELWEASSGSLALHTERRPRLRTPSWMAAAAALFLTVAGGLIWLNRPQGDVFREQVDYVVESLVPPDTAIPREEFRLRWTAGPLGSRYQVRVTTDDLQVLSMATDLTMPEFVLDPGLLTNVPPGARVLWQVDVALPSGEHVSSQTFVAQVR